MAGKGYASVADRSFVAVGSDLDEGEWGAIGTKKYDKASPEDATALLGAPQDVVWKLRLRWGIAGIVEALGIKPAKDLDGPWDACQRRLFHQIGIGVDHDAPAVRAAADRLRIGLLLGDGTGQTQLGLDEEVDFGRNQLTLTAPGGPLAADAKLLELGDTLKKVGETTEALAKALGRSAGGKRAGRPSTKIREAVAACAASFNAVHESIDWFLDRLPAGGERERLLALKAPLEALLARVPSAAVAEPEAAPAPPVQPAPPA
jgi:hypothetical protein